MSDIDWITKMPWIDPIAIEHLRLNRQLIPRTSGVYVITKSNGPLRVSDDPRVGGYGVLYVGKAKSLFSRVKTYIEDPAKVPIISQSKGPPHESSKIKHAGKVLVLMEVQQLSRNGATTDIWVRWAQIPTPEDTERSLIRALRPAFNTIDNPRDDPDWESLD